MFKSVFDNIKIVAVSCAVPTKEITSEDYYKLVDKEIPPKSDKISGIKSVRVSIEKQISSDLGYIAAKKIIEEKNIKPESIGILIYVTQTPDYDIPATSCILHKRLGLSIDCATVDINNGCAGFVYGVQVACSMLNSSNCSRALLIIGDTTTKPILKEAHIAVPFGDATGAVLFEKSDSANTIEISLRTDGSRYSSLIKPLGYRKLTYTPDELKIGNRGIPYVLMNGMDVFHFSITDVPEHINQFLKEQGKTIHDYDSVILHQPNILMINRIAKKIAATTDKVPVSLDRFGNTSGASIPLTLVDKYGSINNNEANVLMCGFGVGLMWGIVTVKIKTDDILPIIYSDDYFEDSQFDFQEYDK